MHPALCFTPQIPVLDSMNKSSKNIYKIWTDFISGYKNKYNLTNAQQFWQRVVVHYTMFLWLDLGFPSLGRLQITKSIPGNFTIIRALPFLNNPKNLDPSYKMDLDFKDCLGRKKTLSYIRRNTASQEAKSTCLHVTFLRRRSERLN